MPGNNKEPAPLMNMIDTTKDNSNLIHNNSTKQPVFSMGGVAPSQNQPFKMGNQIQKPNNFGEFGQSSGKL